MKFNSWLKITVAVLCLLSILCFAVACGKDKPDESQNPTDETPAVSETSGNNDSTDILGSVEDNDAASDIGPEVILPPVKQ